jgi:methyl-accepting chemotaxis protein-1 (serine sensor receptor)
VKSLAATQHLDRPCAFSPRHSETQDIALEYPVNLNRKIPLAFALAMLLSLLAGFGGLWMTSRSLNTFHDEVQRRVADERTATAMQNHFKTQVQEWKNVLLRGSDTALFDKHWHAFEKEEKQVDDMAAGLRTRLTDPELIQQLDGFIAAHRAMAQGYRMGLEKFQATGMEPSVGDAAVKGMDRGPAKAVDELAQHIAQISAQVAEQAYADGRRANALSLALMVLVTGLGTALGWALSRSVVRPLHHAISVASDVAQGDLSRPIPHHGRDETGQLLSALAKMQGQLRALVSEVRGNAQSVATASAEIAQGNSDLAGRTEQQASALQQTASSMEQLDGAVRRNASSAREASSLAQDASRVAVQGGELVEQFVGTMRGIQEASTRIADIIGVIDGIAFQTNILALNAAVEAARAGEQGRGFAVVAAEVRSLAKRSADAAREIKTLIGTSVSRVEQGNALVGHAGQTMTEVVAAIQRVSGLIVEISRASDEQSVGVSHMGEAVSRMDQGTQQNAALVEQTSAAAESLERQARQLVSAVGLFKVEAAPRAG